MNGLYWGEASGRVWAAADDGTPAEITAAEPAVVVAEPTASSSTPPAATDQLEGKDPAEPEAAVQAQKKVDWRERRIAQLSLQLRAAQAAAKAIPSGGPQAAPIQSPGAPAGGLDDVEIDRRAEEKSRQLEATREFSRKCEQTALEGREAFGKEEFNGRVNSLVQILDREDPVSIANYNLLLEAAMETGKGPELIFKLGGDLDEASRILTLPPVKMALELAKLSQAPSATKLSAAPKPISPIGARTSTERISPDDVARADHLSTREWMERREQQMVGKGR